MESVVVLGANPAWQQNVECAKLRPGEVVRLRRGRDGAAGKGFNCSLALSRLGMRVLLVTGLGTDSADWEAAAGAEGIEMLGFPLLGPARRATTVRDLSNGEVTELVEEGPSAAPGAQALLEQHLERDPELPLAVCGTLAGGIDLERVLLSLAKRSGLVVIDSVPLVRCLWSGKAAHRLGSGNGLCLKLNESEWAGLSGTDLEAALLQARQRFPHAQILCTRGSQGSMGVSETGERFTVPAPPFPPGTEVHPIGAGDAYTAGLFGALARGVPFREACVQGAAAARASCLDPLPSRLTLRAFEESLFLMDSHA